MLFPVDIDLAPVTVAMRKPYYQIREIWWPMLPMSSWVKALWNEAPQMILGGHRREDIAGWRTELANFWNQYRKCNGNHQLFCDNYDTSLVVPFFLHGDEGRGACRRQFMVESFQPVLSWKGVGSTNESG